MSDKRYTLIDHTQDKKNHFDDKEKAENNRDLLKSEGHDVELQDQYSADGGTKPQPTETTVEKMGDAVDAIDEIQDSGIDTDPLTVLPGFMTDTIQGAEAVNKRGYAMIAHQYDIEVSVDMLQSPWDNEEGRVVCKAVATTDGGKDYAAYGTACEGDGDDASNLIELADTRAQKRAVQWASGFGIVSYQELTGQLE